MASAGCFSFFRRPAVSARPNAQRIIRINARGRQLATSTQTLSKSNSPILQDLVAEAASHSSVDLNVDPQVFQHVLNFLRDDAGFMLPNSSDELLALLELAEHLKMPELVKFIIDCPAGGCEPTTFHEWPTSTGTCGKYFAGQAIMRCSLAQLMDSFGDEAEWETASTFPDDYDDDSESEGSDCSEKSIGGYSEMSHSVSKNTPFISPEEVFRYSHRGEDMLFPLHDLEQAPVRRQWLLGH